MKLLIKDLELKLDKKIKRNHSSIGVDTATLTGVGFINTDDKEITIEWSLLSFEAPSTNQLYKLMYKEFEKFIDKNTKIVIVEDVFLGMNPDVTIKLARFGGLMMAQAINKNVPFETIGAKSARAKLFKLDSKKYKGKSKEAVADYLKSIGIEIDEDNCADGVILALLGIIEGIDYRSKAEIARSNKKMKSKKHKLDKKK
ncbi:MAG: crossover junction endodeoxyribonuclease RuvC [Nanoarchaeota archaeon]